MKNFSEFPELTGKTDHGEPEIKICINHKTTCVEYLLNDKPDPMFWHLDHPHREHPAKVTGIEANI